MSKPKFLIRSIALIILLSISLSTVNLVAFAAKAKEKPAPEAPAPAPTPPVKPQGPIKDQYNNETLKEHTFSVGKVLRLQDQQGQKYFQGENSPIVNLVLEVLDFATKLIGSFAVILLIIAGFRFMIAQGNSQKIDEAKEMLKYVVYGLVVTFVSYVIVIFVQSLFNVV